MTFRISFQMVLTGLCLLGATGCVSYPISKQVRKQAQTTKDVSFLTIWEKPDAYKGRMVIWGGRILKTVNETNGGFVYVLQAPLDYQEWPTSTKLSQGRFMARSSSFLDPEIYRKGAKITIAGELSGTETQNVDKTSYDYPVVTLREVYFWRQEHPNYTGSPPLGWGWYGPYQQYYDNYHGDYYSPGNYDPNFDLDWGQRFDYSSQEPEKGEHQSR